MKFLSVTLVICIFFAAGCSKSNSSDSKALDSYRDYIIKLPKNDFYSVTKALDYYKKNFSSASQAFKDSAFIDFRNLYYNVINTSSEAFWNNQDFLNKIKTTKDAPEVKKFLHDIDINGIRLSTTEGDYYLDEKADFLYNNFSSTASPPVRDYLKIRMKELEQQFSEDAMLLIPFRTLGERIRTWENYIGRYPESPLLADAKYSYHLYMNTFLTGLDNSPIAIDQKLKPEIKSEYEYYISANKGSRSAQIVNDYYNFLSQRNFMLTQDIEEFYQNYSIEPMQGVQPPTR